MADIRVYEGIVRRRECVGEDSIFEYYVGDFDPNEFSWLYLRNVRITIEILD
jgi:hypothetical protein